VRRICFVRAGFLIFGGYLLSGAVALADPIGEWQVAKGYARIRIENCNNAFWGAVAWEQQPGGVDDKNPDPSKRGRPTLGMPVLLDMKQTEQNKWAGQIYNSENGKTYDSYISLGGPDVLKVRGCVASIFCGGEDWTRVPPQTPPTATTTPPGGAGRTSTTSSKPAPSPPASQQKPAVSTARTPSPGSGSPTPGAPGPSAPIDPETASVEDFCSMVLNNAGAPH
jgi:uncharacterized protein (DUF2147 family)